MGCLTIVLPLVLGLSLLAWVIPSEKVPRIEVVGDGQQYVLQSFRESVLWPTGAALALFLSYLTSKFFRIRKSPAIEKSPAVASESLKADWIRIVFSTGRLLRRVVVVVLYVFLLLCCLHPLVWTPLLEFRCVRVTKSTAVFETLWVSREVDLRDIETVRVERQAVELRGGQRSIDLEVVAEEKSGIVHRSVNIRLDLKDPFRNAYESAMMSLADALQRRK